MALLPILVYPDPKLLKVARPVQAVDARIQSLIADMTETMYDANGIGLAATQVDVHERLVVIDVSEERDKPQVFVDYLSPLKRNRIKTKMVKLQRDTRD